MPKSLDASGIAVTHGSGLVISPFDCSSRWSNDDNGHSDTGHHDFGVNDADRCN
ncbi:hypothetical protein ABZ646_41110 [Streptomyces sp. NPDC007162]|uniref:hypothetical protein n=1 Tax=Streptomyces sp. NPDC007162 TaxID=3156917 RepID=UPI0033F86E46